MSTSRPDVPALRRSRGVVAGAILACALAVAACGASGGDGEPGAADRDASAPNPSPVRVANLVPVDPDPFRVGGGYVFRFSTGGNDFGYCLLRDSEVTCTGLPAADAENVPMTPLGRANGVNAGTDGIRYTLVEGVELNEVRLNTGEVLSVGDVTCGLPDGSNLECSAAGGGFTIVGPERGIIVDGPVLAPNVAEAPGPTRGNSPQREAGGDAGAGNRSSESGSGIIREVSAGGRTVRASAPACDSRGIRIMESVVVQPGVDTRRAIADALAAYPGSEFTVPGQCPSLRARIDGADVYAVYIDYGHDTSALCSAVASGGGNARVLSNRDEYVSPC